MADFNNRWIEIFRAGDYGEKGVWTEQQLDQVVRNFAAGIWKPPAVLGHPETDSPAMAWVSGLQRTGAVLEARFDQVQPELEATVQSGRHPNRSAAFYLDPQGAGPVLRHVGFLGATPPEVKGLAPVKFSSESFTSIDFTEDPMSEKVPTPEETKKSIRDGIREFFAEMFGGQKKDQPAFSEEQINARVTTAVTAATAPLLEQIKAMGTQFTELGNALKASQVDAKKGRAAALIAKLKGNNRWVPAFDEAGLPAVLEHLATSDATVKFGEAGKEKTSTPFDVLASFLESAPVIVPTGSRTTKTGTAGKVFQFNEAPGIELDTASVALNARAEVIERERKVSFGEALNIARQELASGGAAGAA